MSHGEEGSGRYWLAYQANILLNRLWNLIKKKDHGNQERKSTFNELQSLISTQQCTIEDLYREKGEMQEKLKSNEKFNNEQEQKIAQAENKILTLNSKICSLEREKNQHIFREEDQKRRMRTLEEQAERKERDLSEVRKEINMAFSQLKEKDCTISRGARKLKDANTKISQLTEEKGHMLVELDQLREQNKIENGKYWSLEMEKNKRIKELEDGLCEKHMEINALPHKLQTTEMENQKLKDDIEELGKKLNDMKEKKNKLRHDNTCLEDENALLKRQKEQMALSFQKDEEVQHSVLKRQADTSASRIRDLEQSLRETKEKIEILKKENERITEENHHLKQQKVEIETQHTSSKKAIEHLEAEKAALQTSSETRENMLQKDMEKLRQQHIADLREQGEMHMSEKGEMQAKEERLLQILREEKQVQREALRTTTHQMAHTQAVTNQLLHGAFAWQRRQQEQQQQYRPAANIREIEDDS